MTTTQQIGLLVIMIIFVIVTYIKFRDYKFEYKNNLDRTCGKCKQRQLYIIGYPGRNNYQMKKWITIGPIIDTDCWCHDHTGINNHE